MSTIKETHRCYDRQSTKEGIQMIIDLVQSLTPDVSLEAFKEAINCFERQDKEQQARDLQACEKIKTYVNSLNFYFQLGDPSYVNDPHQGPFQLEIFLNIHSKPFYYCPQHKDGRLMVVKDDIIKAMQVITDPKSVLLFRANELTMNMCAKCNRLMDHGRTCPCDDKLLHHLVSTYGTEGYKALSDQEKAELNERLKRGEFNNF